jgi:hypothetical protein
LAEVVVAVVATAHQQGLLEQPVKAVPAAQVVVDQQHMVVVAVVALEALVPQDQVLPVVGREE